MNAVGTPGRVNPYEGISRQLGLRRSVVFIMEKMFSRSLEFVLYRPGRTPHGICVFAFSVVCPALFEYTLVLVVILQKLQCSVLRPYAPALFSPSVQRPFLGGP